jgi:hypothetical protein
VALVETGDYEMIGGRRCYLSDQPFRMTPADGPTDLDFDGLLQLASLTAIRRPARCGMFGLNAASGVLH